MQFRPQRPTLRPKPAQTALGQYNIAANIRRQLNDRQAYIVHPRPLIVERGVAAGLPEIMRQGFRGRRYWPNSEPSLRPVRWAVFLNKGQPVALPIDIIIGADNRFAGHCLAVNFPVGGYCGRRHPGRVQRPHGNQRIVVKAAAVGGIKSPIRLIRRRVFGQSIVRAVIESVDLQTLPGRRRQDVYMPRGGLHYQSLLGMAFRQIFQSLRLGQAPVIHFILRPQIFRGSAIHQEVEINRLQGMNLRHLQ